MVDLRDQKESQFLKHTSANIAKQSLQKSEIWIRIFLIKFPQDQYIWAMLVTFFLELYITKYV